MKKILLITPAVVAIALGFLLSCGKKSSEEVMVGNIKQTTETNNGVTYKSFVNPSAGSYKGILVLGSGNDESNPTPGSLTESVDIDLCTKAAQNGYVAAIVQYRATPGLKDWNTSAQMVSQDFSATIVALSGEYGVDKSNSVVGGYSYASFMLLTDAAYYNDIAYCKGILAACAANDATDFKVPIYAIACSGDNEGNYSGADLYNNISANSKIKSASGGVTDNSCSTHCGNSWTEQLYAKMVTWMP